jgi:hypothetical protein
MLLTVPGGRFAAEEVKVTVAVILGSPEPGGKPDPRIKAVAEEVVKTDPKLKSFRLATTTSMAVAIGGKEKFPLIDDRAAEISVLRKEDRVCLKVKPPDAGGIMYNICCGKFLPILTNYYTKEKKERLILAVMVAPCPGKPCKEE